MTAPSAAAAPAGRRRGVLAWLSAVLAVLRRPDLWPTALVVLLRLARPGWWSRAPFLPVPDRAYWSFRAITAYGTTGVAPSGDDLVAFLSWCRAWSMATGR